MNQRSDNTADPPGRDAAILSHVARFRISTNEVLHQLFFQGQTPNAVTKVTHRLCETDHLRRFPLHHPQIYFTLGTEGARQLGVSVIRTRPLGPQSLPTEYATLCYATFRNRARQRLTPPEVQEQFPGVPAHLAFLPCLLDDDTTPPVLILMRVDLGGRPDHIARKCVRDFRGREQRREFEQLIARQQIRLVIATGTMAKAAAIQESINQRVWPQGLSIRLSVNSGLLPLIARTNHGP